MRYTKLLPSLDELIQIVQTNWEICYRNYERRPESGTGYEELVWESSIVHIKLSQLHKAPLKNFQVEFILILTSFLLQKKGNSFVVNSQSMSIKPASVSKETPQCFWLWHLDVKFPWRETVQTTRNHEM